MKECEVVMNGVAYVKKQETGPITLVRTYSAGVHFGTLESHAGKNVRLTNARRLWSWQGACSLSQVAVHGVDLSNSKISVPVPQIDLTDAIEVIPMSEAAGQAMMEAESWKA